MLKKRSKKFLKNKFKILYGTKVKNKEEINILNHRTTTTTTTEVATTKRTTTPVPTTEKPTRVKKCRWFKCMFMSSNLL